MGIAPYAVGEISPFGRASLLFLRVPSTPAAAAAPSEGTEGKERRNMASNRINRINEEIMKELSSLLRTVKDPRVQDTMISITRVETTPDLRYTKVYVSFLQSDRAKQAMVGLKSAGGYLRRELGHALQLRYAPEIVWSEDDSIEYGAKMLQLINSLEGKNHEEADEG